MNYQNEFRKIDFSLAELATAPKHHLAYFITTCLAIDEISFYQKIYVSAKNTVDKIEPETDESLKNIAGKHWLIAQRNLAAKLFEYLYMFEGYKKTCDRKNDNSMLPFIKKTNSAIKKLKNLNGYKIAEWYRDSVTNHYISHKVGEIIDDGVAKGNKNTHSVYLHEKKGNSHYILGEQFLVIKSFKKGSSSKRSMKSFNRWVDLSSDKVMNLHEKFCLEFMKKYFPKKLGDDIGFLVPDKFVAKLNQETLPLMWILKK